MADTEFEQFRIFLDRIPDHIKSTAQTYTLVHDIDLEDSPTSSNGEEPVKTVPERATVQCSSPFKRAKSDEKPSLVKKDSGINRAYSAECAAEEDCYTIGPALRTHWPDDQQNKDFHVSERRRRRLPEIPKIKKVQHQTTLAEELHEAINKLDAEERLSFAVGGRIRPSTMLKCNNYLSGEDVSPDVDSGNSTAHSPDGLKSVSPQLPNDSMSPISSISPTSRLPTSEVEIMDPTHRGLHKFITRHRDEVEIEIGDPIYVQKEADDLWCEGINMRTGQQGIFPSAYVVDVEYSDFDPQATKVRRERYMLGYLGSVETTFHKGNSVLCQAVKKIKTKNYTPHSCILEISDIGIRMVDRKKPARKEVPCHDYFYSLKNVSFCAFHPRDHRYMGFITKHPQCDRFACHVFLGNESTRPVAEAVGRAFQRFYQTYIETAYPVEDIYIE